MVKRRNTTPGEEQWVDRERFLPEQRFIKWMLSF